MRLEYHRDFAKQYKKLGTRDRDAVDAAILKFADNPLDPSLRNHDLAGKLAGYRSISAGFDLRVLFKEKDGYALVLFLKVGSHSQLYG